MLEFEFNAPVETAVLVEFFARCGWEEDEAGPKLEWVLATSDDWVLCKFDGELIGFGRACRFGPLNRVVCDVLVDSRFRGRGLKAEIVRLLAQGAGGLEQVSVFSTLEGRGWGPLLRGKHDSSPLDLPLVDPDTYLGKEAGARGQGE
ncbi:MAG: GNAT family N-acetyltransferase [Actinobacteria bacterium]|nr:GNAT family N-acetyltransferase [Actinomycetota bacterium]